MLYHLIYMEIYETVSLKDARMPHWHLYNYVFDTVLYQSFNKLFKYHTWITFLYRLYLRLLLPYRTWKEAL